MKHLLKPYGRSDLDVSSEYFNKRLSRARRTVECAFGIIRSKWQILDKPILTDIDHADKIVKAICVLHNVIIDREGMEHNKKRRKI
ncbi:DDE superfamily endonuclease [Popillia japonica]|uniref:DDE superfamily endonuclease n=1 Tax=Popillia japonica TaxID=7064 RepID=A0AAW1L263_POPJA